MVPRNKSCYQTSVTSATWRFALRWLLPSQPSSPLNCICSFPHQVCLLKSTVSHEPCCFLSLSASFQAFAPNAQVNQNLSCGTQTSVSFKAPQRIPKCSQGGKPLHQRTGEEGKANWIDSYGVSLKRRKHESILKCLEILFSLPFFNFSVSFLFLQSINVLICILLF